MKQAVLVPVPERQRISTRLVSARDFISDDVTLQASPETVTACSLSHTSLNLTPPPAN